MTSSDPDVKVYKALGSFNIPSVENGKNILNVTSSLHSSDRDIAKLNGNVITGNIDLGAGSSKIELEVNPNVDPNEQILAYRERIRQGAVNYHNGIYPGLNFSVSRYQTKSYLKKHYYFFGIRTLRKLSSQ